MFITDISADTSQLLSTRAILIKVIHKVKAKHDTLSHVDFRFIMLA